MSHGVLEMLQWVPMADPCEQADGTGDVDSSARTREMCSEY
jgi:hypothetical protein